MIGLYHPKGKIFFDTMKQTSDNSNHILTTEPDFEKQILPKLQETIDFNNMVPEDVHLLTSELNIYRKEKNRIKFTPNNPQSSRSHLFVMFDFVYPSGKTGTLILIDMGGRESTIDILNMFLEKPKDRPWQLPSMIMGAQIDGYIKRQEFKVTSDELSWKFNKDTYNTNPTFKREMDNYVKNLNNINVYDPRTKNFPGVNDLLKESIFINETINQVIYFFNEIIGKPNTMKTVDFGNVNTGTGVKIYNESDLLIGPPKNKRKNYHEKIGMYTALEYLQNMEKQGKPTKYVMMVHIRNEDKYCNATLESLRFAQDIKST